MAKRNGPQTLLGILEKVDKRKPTARCASSKEA